MVRMYASVRDLLNNKCYDVYECSEIIPDKDTLKHLKDISDEEERFEKEAK
jgi:hypothetical protein